jgi:Holliday junction resolvasome RuvABC DNA-binding subunit
LKKQLTFIEKQLAEIDKELGKLIENHDDENVSNLRSIPCIGHKTAIALMAYTKGMQSFDNHRADVAVYVCARSAKKHNKSCHELYERLLAKGKAKKLTLITVANKLLK